jgi:hypothetical protein
MKDLDFDELDRAVNSLMTNVPKSPSQGVDNKEKLLDLTPTLGENDKPSFSTIEEAAARAADASRTVVSSASVTSGAAVSPVRATSTTVQPLVRPRSASVIASSAPASRRPGRFMDVVRSSADGKKPDLSQHISRQGVTIDPVSTAPTMADVVPSKQPEPQEGDSAGLDVSDSAQTSPMLMATPVVNEPVREDDRPMPTSDWPDPLDMATKTDTSKDEKVVDSSSELDESEKQNQQSSDATDGTEPLSSPFLSGAKVEKRPLGGSPVPDLPVADPMTSDSSTTNDISKSVDDPNKQLPADPADIEPQLPEEFQGDLMAVEADTTHDVIKQKHESMLKKVMSGRDEKASAQAPRHDAPVTVSEPTAPTGPTSIPQQYREEPSTGDQDNGAIYDTDTYHQPLEHPAKKKSGWLWVIWIIVILLLGVGGGAAIYFLKLV